MGRRPECGAAYGRRERAFAPCFTASCGRRDLHVGQHLQRPIDPYLRRNPLTQDRGFEDLEHDGYSVTVNPVVLPHPSRLTREENLLASGPGGLLGRQGFYVYRGDRLVVAGGWLACPECTRRHTPGWRG